MNFVGRATLKPVLSDRTWYDGPRADIAGRTHPVLERRAEDGDCLCLCTVGGTEVIVDVCGADVESFAADAGDSWFPFGK